MVPITLTEVRGKDHKRYGTTYPGEVLEGTTVEIEPGKSITIMKVVAAGSRYVPDPKVLNIGTGKPKMVPCEEHLVVKKFNIGDTAEVGSYNLVYTGTVRKITEKTVTVVEYEDSPGMKKTYRFDIYTFARRNWDFDAEDVAKRNHETMMVI